MALLILLLLLFGVRCARPGESDNTLPVQRPQPHTTNPWEEEENEIVGDKEERADHANRRASALLLKSASPTPSTSNTGSLRSLQRDTERSTKVLRYWEILQRWGANECLWATKAPRGTRADTYGKGNTTLKGCIELLLILNSMHNSATDRRWSRSQSKTPPARKPAVLTTLSSSLGVSRQLSTTLLSNTPKAAGQSSKKISEGATNQEPVAEVLAYLHVQISPISCNVVGSILHVLEKTLTQQLQATGGRGWVWGDTTSYTANWCKQVRDAWLASSYCMDFKNFVASNKIHPLKKNTCQDFLIIPSLCAAALETERRCFSNVILASKVEQFLWSFL